ncbi:MAG TPA: RagB/SusD family nutrient uptake outer membrane protein [Cyclobacteriaceae bacterium]|nr:RagB/SusD family nutrient uptake outer membrane protein [Cyclobacteriaceae bacterium]
MKTTIKYALITALFAGGTACTNLDEHLPSQLTYQLLPSNPGFGQATNANKPQPNDNMQGAFNQVLNGTATNGGFFAVQEGGTDEAVITQKGGDWFDGGLYIKIHQHQLSSTTWAINDTWNQAYIGIYQCNNLLAGTNQIPGITPNQTAQLRFLRAYFHWRLMDVFGNVKIIQQVNVDAAQTTRAAVYNFIESELLAAIPDLSTSLQDYGRVNQAGAYALLARLYLNAGVYTGTTQYQKAINAADMVINSGLYTLAPNYKDIFSPDNCCNAGANMEMIWVAPFDQSTGQGATWHEMTLHYPSQLTYNFTSQPWNGFATLEDFYNSYDSLHDSRWANNFLHGQQYAADGTTPLLDLAFTKGFPHGANLNYTPHINELYPNSWRSGGARFSKYSFKFGAQQNDDNDFPLLRYAEVLLNKAEALQRLSGTWTDDPTARALVNQVRARAGAGVTPFTSMLESDMLAERGREMFIEGARRTDMIRFGAYINGTWWEHTTADGNSNHLIMAIPNEQITASSSTPYPLTQNPGY